MTRGPDREHTREDVLDAMRAREPLLEPWTAKEAADAVGCSRSIAYNRLRELNELDRVHTKTVGRNGRVWWLDADET